MYSDEDYVDDADSSRRSTKRKNRTQDFNDADKKKLALLVRASKHIWDTTNILHSNSAAVDKTWCDISIQMGKPKDKCKLAWTALRESYRYHARNAKADPLGNAKNSCPYSKELSFLARVKRVQKPLYPLVEHLNDETADNTMEQDELSSSGYLVKEETYRSSEVDLLEHSAIHNMEPESPQSFQNGEETTTYDCANETSINEANTSTRRNNAEMDNFVRQLSKLVNSQNEFMRNFRGTDNFVYRTQLRACDALLQQIPKKTAETTLIEIQNYILKKINDQQKRKNCEDS